MINKNKVLYTDLDIEKCRQRFNEDINSYGNERFAGQIYNNDFWIMYTTRGRYRVAFELRANLKQEDEVTRIQYEFSGGINKIINIILLILPLVMLIVPLLNNNQNFSAWDFIAPYLSATYGFIGLVIFPLIMIQSYFYHRKLVKFVEIMLNCREKD